MPQKISHIKKSILINLYLFYILYFALVLAERQVLRSGLLGFSLAKKPDLLETAAGFAIGSFLVIALTRLLKERQGFLRVFMISGLILGSIFLNVFNSKLFFPLYTVTNPGDLNSLGKQRWDRILPYEMYADVYDQYLLHDVYVNPKIDNYEELKRIYRFGVNLKQSQDMPTSINQQQFARIEEISSAEYSVYQNNDIEYRLYHIKELDDILITTFDNITLFVPLDLITE